MVVLEAQAVGLPVLTSRGSGLRNACRRLRALARGPTAPGELAARVLALLADEPLGASSRSPGSRTRPPMTTARMLARAAATILVQKRWLK